MISHPSSPSFLSPVKEQSSAGQWALPSADSSRHYLARFTIPNSTAQTLCRWVCIRQHHHRADKKKPLWCGSCWSPYSLWMVYNPHPSGPRCLLIITAGGALANSSLLFITVQWLYLGGGSLPFILLSNSCLCSQGQPEQTAKWINRILSSYPCKTANSVRTAAAEQCGAARVHLPPRLPAALSLWLYFQSWTNFEHCCICFPLLSSAGPRLPFISPAELDLEPGLFRRVTAWDEHWYYHVGYLGGRGVHLLHANEL